MQNKKKEKKLAKKISILVPHAIKYQGELYFRASFVAQILEKLINGF